MGKRCVWRVDGRRRVWEGGGCVEGFRACVRVERCVCERVGINFNVHFLSNYSMQPSDWSIHWLSYLSMPSAGPPWFTVVMMKAPGFGS